MADIRVEKVQTISCNNLSDKNYKAFDMCCSIQMIVFHEAIDFLRMSSNLLYSLATNY